MSTYFNNEVKDSFINAMLVAKKSYIQAYEGLFSNSETMEGLFNKDLATFTSDNLLVLFKDIARRLKYTTILSYNSLVKNYKEWVIANVQGIEVVDGVCTVEQLNSITNFKQYVILNDEEMDELTFEATVDGADYNSLIFMRLFWETDGQESAGDICKLNVSDVNYDNCTVKIFNSIKNQSTIYPISNWLRNIIKTFAEMERITFFNRHGSYFIGTADMNNGYIFRMTKSAKTKPESIGIAMSAIKMSNVLNNYCTTNLDEVITVNDLMMSLALKYMVTNTKTPSEMFNEKRYFKNIPTSVYKDILNTYAQEKYEEEYETYVKTIDISSDLV